jgi:hypothetical protein|tara:strand:+ start:121 stop:705 length:585 start_codon:yes stop_codon:yes gene_type:complete
MIMQKTEEQRLKYNAYMKEWLRKKRGTKQGATPGRPKNTFDELWKKVDKRGENECWEWTGYISESGYGRTQINDKSYYAHRVIFDLVYPNVIKLNSPKNKKESGFLMHSCDNRLCCNPAHLKVATLRENNEDCWEKGRRVMPKGGEHHRSVFTNEEIKQVLEMHQLGQTAKHIAQTMNKKRSTVKSLLYRNKEI